MTDWQNSWTCCGKPMISATREAEAGVYQVQGLPVIRSRFQASRGNLRRSYLKTETFLKGWGCSSVPVCVRLYVQILVLEKTETETNPHCTFATGSQQMWVSLRQWLRTALFRAVPCVPNSLHRAFQKPFVEWLNDTEILPDKMHYYLSTTNIVSKKAKHTMQKQKSPHSLCLKMS